SEFRCVTEMKWDKAWDRLAQFGVCVTRQLKSNAVGVFREWTVARLGFKIFQLVGAGQGQPNRVEAIRDLALPRAQRVLGDLPLAHCILVSDAFFPFRDSVDILADAGLDRIVQPGGSVKDAEVIAACNERNVSMVMTGLRHFKH